MIKQKTRASSKPSISEAALHRTVADFLSWMLLPPTVWTTFPAGWGKLGKATAGSLKGSGLKAGFPDILIFHMHGVLGIELKTEKGKASPKQLELFSKLEKVNIPVRICRSLDDLEDILNSHKIPIRKWTVWPELPVSNKPLPAAI
jgi:hypothetical protein